jgi:signal peptidase II
MPLKFWILITVSPVLLVLDQLSKLWILEHFQLGQSLPIIAHFFSLTYVRNTGAAFSLLATAHPAFRVPFFLIMPCMALAIIGLAFFKLKNSEKYPALGYALILAGAFGNLIDRLRFGYVVDFLDFYVGPYHYPVFNVADSAICVGVGFLVWESFQKRKNLS